MSFQDFAGRILDLGGSVLGFPELSRFQLQPIDEMGYYAYLQSMENEHIGFVVTDPFLFYKQYAFELTESDKEGLDLQNSEDTLVLGIVTIRKPFRVSTINLAAPVIVNIKTNDGKQIVLSSRYDYATQSPLFNDDSGQKEG
jgi:flagellar assembly factor FliW